MAVAFVLTWPWTLLAGNVASFRETILAARLKILDDFAKGEISQAEVTAAALIAEASKQFGDRDPTYAEALDVRAELALHAGRTVDAERDLTAAVAIFERAATLDNLHIKAALDALEKYAGLVRQREGRSRQLEARRASILRGLIAHAAKARPVDLAQLDRARVTLMDQLTLIGRNDEILSISRDRVAAFEGERGAGSVDLLTPLADLAMRLEEVRTSESRAETGRLHQRALEILESSYGNDDRRVVAKLEDLARYHRQVTKDPKEEERLLLRLLAISESRSAASLDVVRRIELLTQFLIRQRRWPDAEKRVRQSLAFREALPITTGAEPSLSLLIQILTESGAASDELQMLTKKRDCSRGQRQACAALRP